MKPLPKFVGIVGVLVAIVGALSAPGIIAILPPKIGAILAAVGPIVTLLSHSLTGTGGTPENP
jgi:hypothetical protein